MKNIIVAATLFASAGAASAAGLSLNAPLAGATLSHGVVDMSVFYTDKTDGFEVVAVYATHEKTASPDQLVMVLEDGDEVSFGLPGVSGQIYTFAREGDTVTVDAAFTWTQIAAK